MVERGSEAARFAFGGITVLFEREDTGVDVRAEVERAVRYPVEGNVERVRRFRAQLDAWRWFSKEGRKKGDGYLVVLAVRKLVLFGGRLVLAENEVLYPFHKWCGGEAGGVDGGDRAHVGGPVGGECGGVLRDGEGVSGVGRESEWVGCAIHVG